MSSIKDQIRQEIERRKKICEGIFERESDTYYQGKAVAYGELLAFIDSLPEENNPEPYNPVYDEDYLNEKIAKATKSWEGVDVNKMLADCRGYDEKPSEDLEEAAEEYADGEMMSGLAERAFVDGAKWQKEQMMKEAVEGEIGYWNQTGLSIRLDQSLEKLGYGEDTEVKIIIVKQ